MEFCFLTRLLIFKACATRCFSRFFFYELWTACGLCTHLHDSRQNSVDRIGETVLPDAWKLFGKLHGSVFWGEVDSFLPPSWVAASMCVNWECLGSDVHVVSCISDPPGNVLLGYKCSSFSPKQSSSQTDCVLNGRFCDSVIQIKIIRPYIHESLGN